MTAISGDSADDHNDEVMTAHPLHIYLCAICTRPKILVYATTLLTTYVSKGGTPHIGKNNDVHMKSFASEALTELEGIFTT